MLSVVGAGQRAAEERETEARLRETRRGQSMVTFATGADFQQPGSQALFGADAETRIVRVLLLAGQDGVRRREAVRRDSFHLHLFLKFHVDGPGEGNRNQLNKHLFKYHLKLLVW